MFLTTQTSNANAAYQALLFTVLREGDFLETRNHSCYSHVGGLQVTFDTFPLVTLRKTAWRKAIREMEWFMSGQSECPKELLDWWQGQLASEDNHYCGYAQQYRRFAWKGSGGYFDQIAFALDALKNHPNSRRIVLTTWNPAEMAYITTINNNPNTPSNCHGSLVQLFVRDGKLTMHSYQRSADLLLGIVHNWVQYWALLLYFAAHVELQPGRLVWTFGDAHIYDDPSHVETAESIIAAEIKPNSIALNYNWSGAYDQYGTPQFLASDFSLVGEVPPPVVTTRPKLF